MSENAPRDDPHDSAVPGMLLAGISLTSLALFGTTVPVGGISPAIVHGLAWIFVAIGFLIFVAAGGFLIDDWDELKAAQRASPTGQVRARARLEVAAAWGYAAACVPLSAYISLLSPALSPLPWIVAAGLGTGLLLLTVPAAAARLIQRLAREEARLKTAKIA